MGDNIGGRRHHRASFQHTAPPYGDGDGDILQMAYWQITSNPVYSSAFAALALVAAAYAKAQAQRLLANALLTQVRLDRPSSRRLREYASFQLQDSAFVTQVSVGGRQGEIQDFKSYEMERLPGSQPQTVIFRMAEQSGGLFWVPDLLRIAPPSETPTLRGAPLGNGPSWNLTAALLLSLAAAVGYLCLVAQTLSGVEVALRLVWFAIVPIALASWTDRPCSPILLDPKDSQATAQLAAQLRSFYERQSQPGTGVLHRAAAAVELQRARRDPEHFRKKAQVAAQDPSGLQLPEEIRAVFNTDLIDGSPHGYGHGTWLSWLLPVVWIAMPDQKHPAWMAKLPTAVQRHVKELYDKLFTTPDASMAANPRMAQQQANNKRREEERAAEIVTLCCFAWHKTTLIQLLLDQADDLHRIKFNDHSTLNYNGGAEDGGAEEGWRSVEGPPRRMETITLGPQAQELRSDVESFLSPGARELFRQRLLPYQRCYLLHGPPGNGKSSILQALSIKFGLKLYFLKVTSGMSKAELEGLLGPLRESAMVCIEDAESAFPSDEEVERLEAEARQVQLVADQSKRAGAGADNPADGGRSDGGSSGTSGAASTAPPQLVSAKVFVDLIRGEGMGASPPEKRLIFFSTNHVSKMPLEIKQLADQQGARTEFPNCNRQMTAGLFDLFFPEADFEQESSLGAAAQQPGPGLARQRSDSDQRACENVSSVAALQGVRGAFLHAVETATWFPGWDRSNICGASLSEYFQRHRDNPATAAKCVSGSTGSDTLQRIVERSQPAQNQQPLPHDTGKPTLADSSHTGGNRADDHDVVSDDAVDMGTDLRRTLSARVLGAFGLSGAHMFALMACSGYALVSVEIAIRWQPVAMGVLAVVLALAHSLSIGLAQKLSVSMLLGVLCSLDCKIEAAPAQLDETLLCVAHGLSALQSIPLWESYAQPKLLQVQQEAWAAIPMALCTCIFVIFWLSFDFILTRCSSFFWVRFQVHNRTVLARYAEEGLQREHRSTAPRLALQKLEDRQDKLGVPKLRTSNYDSDSVAANQYRKVAAEIDSNTWSALPHMLADGAATVTIWIRGFNNAPGPGQVTLKDQARLEFRVWRWGGNWFSSRSPPKLEPRDIIFSFLESQRHSVLMQEMLEPPSIPMRSWPPAQATTQPGPDMNPYGPRGGRANRGGNGGGGMRGGGFQQPTVPVGGMSSFVWPEAPASLFDLFRDALEFQSSTNRRWYMKRGIPYRRGYFLTGTASCGKTHFVKLLARVLGAELHVIDLADPRMTDETLINCFQHSNLADAPDPASEHSVVLFKGVEKVVQYRTCLNKKLSYTTLLNVLDGPFASTNGCINIISCSDFAHFRQDTTSVDALLRPGRIAKQVDFSASLASSQIEDMFCMMLGTGTDAPGPDQKLVPPPSKAEQRPSQFAAEQNETVRAAAQTFKRNWLACFQPEESSAPTPELSFTLVDVKNYVSSFFTGQQTWSVQEISDNHRRKLAAAVDPQTLLECKHRLMELRREAKTKAAGREPRKLATLQKALKEQDESASFFVARVDQSRELLAELCALAPEAEMALPTFARRYKLRTAKETETISHLVQAIELADNNEAIVGECLGAEDSEVTAKKEPTLGRPAFNGRGRGRARRVFR